MELGEGVDHQAPEPPTRLRRVRIRVTLFFDGTRNNSRNTQARLAAAKKDPSAINTIRAHGGPDTSYANDESNVARLREYDGTDAPGYDYYLRVYTEGIGTTNLESDSTRGSALGTGSTGVPAKVTRGVATALTLIARLRDLTPSTTLIERLTVDTCGFSRGAAAARHCVHRVLHSSIYEPETGVSLSMKRWLEASGWHVGQVAVQAVGLFDTVSSYGLAISPSYDANVADLHLDAIREAAAVYQLAAAEEYRQRFSLTNIASAGSKGRQVYLPGGHSDIGGGYIDGEGEHKRLVADAPSADVAKFLLDRGWYRGTTKGPELHHVDESYQAYDSWVTIEYLDAERRSIAGVYTFIPLRLMADFFTQQGIPIQSLLYTKFDPQGVPARARIEADAKSGRASTPAHWEQVDPELARLRHGHLHVTFSTDIGMGVRLQTTGSWLNRHYRPYRLVYSG